MIGLTPGNISGIRPLKDGVIADFDIAKEMLQNFIRKAMASIRNIKWVKLRVVVGVPSCITSVENKAIIDAALQAGAPKKRFRLRSIKLPLSVPRCRLLSRSAI